MLKSIGGLPTRTVLIYIKSLSSLTHWLCLRNVSYFSVYVPLVCIRVLYMFKSKCLNLKFGLPLQIRVSPHNMGCSPHNMGCSPHSTGGFTTQYGVLTTQYGVLTTQYRWLHHTIWGAHHPIWVVSYRGVLSASLYLLKYNSCCICK
jgi:hypothetical protein